MRMPKIHMPDVGGTGTNAFRSGGGVIAASVMLLLAMMGVAGAQSGTLIQVDSFGTNPGNLRMFKYIPPELPASAPLVVAMHGCRQKATSYDNETGWIPLADRFGFALLLPEQKGLLATGAEMASLEQPMSPFPFLDINNYYNCFNWFEQADSTRDQGEALSIKQMIDRMKTDHNVDNSRVFVTGLSAGGAMTSVMLATYPEVFAGGAIIAGLPHRCAANAGEAFQCMNPGRNLAPATWGTRVRNASSHTGPWPRISIWHGSSDNTVVPLNARELMEQWTNVHGIDQTPDVTDTIRMFPHQVYQDAAGNAMVETITITGMEHGTPVDPGTGEEQCGTAAPYILDVDVCSSLYIARFWGLDNGNAADASGGSAADAPR